MFSEKQNLPSCSLGTGFSIAPFGRLPYSSKSKDRFTDKIEIREKEHFERLGLILVDRWRFPVLRKGHRVNDGLSGEKTCAAQPSEFVDIFTGYPNEFENFSI